MIFRYNGIALQGHEIESVAVEWEQNYSPRNTAFSDTKTIRLRGMIVASGQAAIQSRAAQIASAFALNGFDAGLYADSGALTEINLSNAGSIAGVRVNKRPAFSATGNQAHFVTGLPFAVELSAEYLRGAQADPYLSYREVITRRGNGQGIRVMRPVDFGQWVEQPVTSTSPVVVVQQGEAVKRLEWDVLPPAIFPNRILNPLEDAEASEFSPQRNGLQFFGYGLQWRYVMTLASSQPLPHPSYK